MKQAYLDCAQSVVVSKSYDYEGNPITFNRGDNVMVSATEMAKPFGKLVGDWLRLKSTDEFLSSLSADMQIPISELVAVNKGGNCAQGTWLHEEVALEFARWLSPAFAIWCNRRIKELLTEGRVQLQSLTPAQQLLANAQMLVEMEQRQMEQERRQALIENKVERIETRIRDNGFMSVMGFANIHHLNIGKKAAQAIGRLASKWCKRNGRIPEKTKHERWGEVNTYPMEALKCCFAEFYPDKIF